MSRVCASSVQCLSMSIFWIACSGLEALEIKAFIPPDPAPIDATCFYSNTANFVISDCVLLLGVLGKGLFRRGHSQGRGQALHFGMAAKMKGMTPTNG